MYANKRGFSALFEDENEELNDGEGQPSSAQDLATLANLREEEQNKRRKESYVLHIGPKFRPKHHTPFRATNVQVIKADTTGGQGSTGVPTNSLFDFVIDDVRAGTVRAYTGLDIVLETLIHPDSPKLIKMKLAQLDVDGILDTTTGGIDVPLYLNLTNDQFNDILYQLGLPERENDVSLVRMNVQGTSSYDLDPTEQFINQFIGRMGRYKTNVSSTWDTREDFFQNINFKIRIGPEKKHLLQSTQNLSRGTSIWDCVEGDDDGCEVRQFKDCSKDINVLCSQEDQFIEYGKIIDKNADKPKLKKTNYHPDELKYNDEWLKERGKKQNKQNKQFNQFLDTEPEETGTSHAGVIEHVMRLTTHRVMSPRLRAALAGVSNLIGKQINTKKDLQDIMKLMNGGGKAHLMTLMESEFQEAESSLRTYRDPRAQQTMHNARVFAAGRLIKALN